MQAAVETNRGIDFKDIFRLYPTGPAWSQAELIETDLNKFQPELLTAALVFRSPDNMRKLIWNTYKGSGQVVLAETLSLIDVQTDRVLFSATHSIGPPHAELTEWIFAGSLMPGKDYKITADQTVHNFMSQVNQLDVGACFRNPDIIFAPRTTVVKVKPKTIYDRQEELYRARLGVTPEYAKEVILRDPEVFRLIMAQPELRKQYGTALFDIFREGTDEYKERLLNSLNELAETPGAYSELFMYAGGWQRNMYNKDRDCQDLATYASQNEQILENVIIHLAANPELMKKIYSDPEIFFSMAVLVNERSAQLFEEYMKFYREIYGHEPFDLSIKLGKALNKIVELNEIQCRTFIELFDYIDTNILSYALSFLLRGNNGFYQIQPLCREILARCDRGDTKLFDAADGFTRHNIQLAASLQF